jgi:glycosyltransferase involved in cell wall biosynthesis
MSSKRVLMVYIEPTTYILRLIRELMMKNDWQVNVLFIAQNHSQQWNLPLDGITYEMLPTGRWKAFRILAGKLQSGLYDVLHLAGWGHSHMLMALLAGKLAKVPVLMETDTPLPFRLSFLKRFTKRLIYPWLFSLTTIFLPGGSRQARYLQHYSVTDNKIRIAYMTVDTTSISTHVDATTVTHRQTLRDIHGIGPQSIIFLYVGRMEPHKGMWDLLQAFSQVTSKSPDCHLMLVGDGSMNKAVATLALDHQGIHYRGRLSGIDLLDAYAISDVFVLPSLFEPWGLVVNEAMAAGLPVIASDRVGCIDDLIVVGETGFVVCAESSDQLASTMENFSFSRSLAAAMGKKARQHISPWTTARRAEVIRTTWVEVSA